MICFDCLDGFHGKCLRRNLQGLSECACSTCALPLRAIPSAPAGAVRSPRPATLGARKPYQRKLVDGRKRNGSEQKIPRPMVHAAAESLLDGWDYWRITQKSGLTYEQVRYIKRQLLSLRDAKVAA